MATTPGPVAVVSSTSPGGLTVEIGAAEHNSPFSRFSRLSSADSSINASLCGESDLTISTLADILVVHVQRFRALLFRKARSSKCGASRCLSTEKGLAVAIMRPQIKAATHRLP